MRNVGSLRQTRSATEVRTCSHSPTDPQTIGPITRPACGHHPCSADGSVMRARSSMIVEFSSKDVDGNISKYTRRKNQEMPSPVMAMTSPCPSRLGRRVGHRCHAMTMQCMRKQGVPAHRRSVYSLVSSTLSQDGPSYLPRLLAPSLVPSLAPAPPRRPSVIRLYAGL